MCQPAGWSNNVDFQAWIIILAVYFFVARKSLVRLERYLYGLVALSMLSTYYVHLNTGFATWPRFSSVIDFADQNLQEVLLPVLGPPEFQWNSSHNLAVKALMGSYDPIYFSTFARLSPLFMGALLHCAILNQSLLYRLVLRPLQSAPLLPLVSFILLIAVNQFVNPIVWFPGVPWGIRWCHIFNREIHAVVLLFFIFAMTYGKSQGSLIRSFFSGKLFHFLAPFSLFVYLMHSVFAVFSWRLIPPVLEVSGAAVYLGLVKTYLATFVFILPIFYLEKHLVQRALRYL
jgi:hypothetical protein